MNNKQFIAREKVRALRSKEAEMTGPGVWTDESKYRHGKGTGGAGASPCKFVKREGKLE